METTQQTAQAYMDFRWQHETALSDLRSYALDSLQDADRLNPVLNARTMADMVRAAPNLNQYLACSVFIDELYSVLISRAVSAE